MKKNKEVAVLIQARLNSQRIPQKMIKPFAGTTLTDIFMEKIKLCKSFPIENFYFSANEPELIEIAKKHKINVFLRSRESAMSEGTPMSLMYEWHNKLPHKYVVLINACVPFLKPETIDSFVEAYIESDKDGMFAVMEKKNYFWDNSGKILTPLTEDVMNTKTVTPTYEAAHCLYASRLDTIRDGIWMGDFMKNEIELFPVEEKEVFDIDYQWQFDLCEKLWENK
jgi:CMP-N-acetylneuraminic acid synthetase